MRTWTANAHPAGSTSRVSGGLAGRRVGFDAHVRCAEVNGPALSAAGPPGSTSTTSDVGRGQSSPAA